MARPESVIAHSPEASTATPGLELAERVAVVTGAARGLGRAEVLALAARGARVLAVDVLDVGETLRAVAEAGGQVAPLQADLGRPASGERVLRAALEQFGEVDIIVNNAGVLRDRMSFNLSTDDWELVLGVNLSGSYYLAQAAGRHWRRRHAAGAARERVIVNTTSESGLYGNAGQANYAAAKAGVAALTLTLAAELSRYEIRVNAIAPRARTAMSVGSFGNLPHGGGIDPFAPEHVAAVVAWLVSEAAHGVTGQILVAHGGGIEVMRTWSAVRRLERAGRWTDDELLRLRAQLFPEGDTRWVPAPIAELFGAGADREETM